MPVYLGLANVVFVKETLEKKYYGGCSQFRIDWDVNTVEGNQEDDELISIASMNMDEIEIDKLIKSGLEFNIDQQYSNDFVAISRYGGAHWITDWLTTNGTFAWHVNCNPKQKIRAIEIGELMTMEEISTQHAQGINLFSTIKT